MAKIAFLLADDFEDSEFKVPYDRVLAAGHSVTVIGTEAGATVKGKKGQQSVVLQMFSKDARPENFDALVIPGGHSPDKLRMDENAVRFTRKLMEQGKPVAAICHAPSLLIEAGVVRDRRLTSWPSIKTDLVNAGGKWTDAEVVEDGNLITSRKPADLDAFCRALERRLAAAPASSAGH